jgi:hypothetical protein
MTPEKNLYRQHWDQRTTRNESFGLRDVKGRSIGASVSIMPITVVPVEHWDDSCRRWMDGRYADEFPVGSQLVAVAVQPTRAGRNFGASVPCKLFGSAEQAEAEVQRRLSDMRKRYARIAR